MGMNVWEWDGIGNIMTKFTGMGMKSWEWEGMETVNVIPAHLYYQVATVGQLLFAPWAWAYSTLHP